MSDISKLGIQLPPSRLRGKNTEETKRREPTGKAGFYPDKRASLNIIPSPDELATLISRALTALSKGVYWDRGSIVNIVL